MSSGRKSSTQIKRTLGCSFAVETKIQNLQLRDDKGKVVKIMEFGAFVNFLGKQDGLVHISELASKRVAKVGDVVKEGDEVSVKVVGFDRGKVKLSIKHAVA